MKKYRRWIIWIAICMGLFFGAIHASAQTEPTCTLKINGKETSALRDGAVEVTVSLSVDEATEALAVLAVYDDGLLTNVKATEQTLSVGANTVTIDGMTLSREDLEMRVMLFDNSTLAPLMESETFYYAVPAPALEGLTVTLGSRTYTALIDEVNKTIELNIPLYYIKDNTNVTEIAPNNSTAYKGTPTEAEYLAQIKAANPVIVCSPDAAVLEDTENLDLSKPQTLTVCNTKGEQAAYTLSAQAMTVQRTVDFTKATQMITPDTTTYNAGKTPERHNTPLNGGFGSGVWNMEYFAYRAEKIDDVFVRTDATPAYNELVEGGMRMTKDREGDFNLLSRQTSSPGSRVGKTVTKTTFTVEEMTGDGMEIAFGENRYSLQIVPNEDGKTCSLLLGQQGIFEDTGADIALGERAALECVVEELGKQQARATLCLNGSWVYTTRGEAFRTYKLNSYHTKFHLASNTRAKILFEDWGMAYATVPVELNQPYTVTAVTASEDDGNLPKNVLDRNYDTRWSAETEGASITLELDEVRPVAYVGFAAYQGDVRQTTVSVQVSEDGEHWNEVVTKWLSSLTLDMEPIDLDGTHNAKYVRLVGYGNTVNSWNSFTEVSVYGAYAGGGMPVATDGPDSVTVVPDFTQEQQQKLGSFDKLFDRVYLWLASLYDQETGGFYMAKSGADDPEQQPGLEMTFYALSNVTGYTDNGDEIPESIKQRFIKFITDRQDSETGLFIDKQGPVNDRETARNQACVMGWVNRWDIALPYVHPSQKTQTAEAAASTASEETEGGTATALAEVMPEYMESVESYIAWVESWNWETNSWTAGDQTQQSLNYLGYMDAAESEAYKTALLDWLAERQSQFDHGLWAPEVDFNSISGAFKVGLIYNSLGQRIPNVEKVMDSVFLCMETATPTAAHHIRNPLSLLKQISGYNLKYAEEIRDGVADNIDNIIEWAEIFLCPDGGFSRDEKRSMSNFGGIYGSHQLWEGDVDSNLMVLIAREATYDLLGSTVPKLHLPEDFWAWIEGTKEIPSSYSDPKYDIDVTTYKKSSVQDFESLAANTTLTGTEFGGSALNAALKGEILSDSDASRNNVLALSYDASLTAGPSFSMNLADVISAVRYIPPAEEEDLAIEFDIKTESCPDSNNSNNFYLLFGKDRSYALNFGGNGDQKLGTRIDNSHTSYGGTYATLEDGQWHTIQLEQHTGASKEDFFCKIYLDDTLVAVNDYYYGYLEDGSPASCFGRLQLTWYKAGAGKVYLDNIRNKVLPGGSVIPLPSTPPVLEGLSVALGERTYDAVIDQENKRAYLNIPLYWSNNGTINEIGSRSPYSGTVSAADYKTLITAVTPRITCSSGSVAVEAETLDLSLPQTITLRDELGRTTEYTIVANPLVVQRNFNFTNKNLTLINPSTSYGATLSRHNVPSGKDCTRIGSGVWHQEGFAYQTDENGNYIDKDGEILGYLENGAYVKVKDGDFVRDDTSPGYTEKVSGEGLRMVKDRTGAYAMYSVESKSPRSNVNLSDNTISFAVEELTGGAFDLLFGKGRFLLRVLPNEDGTTASLYFGAEAEPADTGMDITLGDTCRVRCMVEKLDASTSRGILWVNDRYLTTVDMTPTEVYDLNAYHIKLRPAEDALCKVMLHEWELRFQVAPTPQKILDIYNDVCQETENIYLWMATLYDGSSDKASGNGFFYAPSSKANPDLFAAELESTGQMISNISSILKYMPVDMKERFINFFETRYDEASGYYYDPKYRDKVNDRQTSRNYGYGTNSLRLLNTYAATEPVTVTSTVPETALAALEAETSEPQTEETVTDLYLPAEYESPQAFRAWIEALPWDTHSWTAGDKLGNAEIYIKRLPEEEQADYWHVWLDYLVNNQNEDGTWGKSDNPQFGVEISGIFKVLMALSGDIPEEVLNTDPSWTAAGLSAENFVPRAQEIYDYIMENLQVTDYHYANTLMLRNTVDVITTIAPMVDGNRLENDLPAIVEYCYDRMKEFKLPGTDAEYVSSIKADGTLYSGASTGMGYDQSLGLSEGCINTATSIIKIRTLISRYYQVAPFSFDKEFAEEFYQILQNELDTQYWEQIYREKYHVDISDSTLEESFEDYQPGTQPVPQLPNPQTFSLSGSNSTALVVSGAQKDGTTGNMLEFTFGSGSSGSAVTFNNPYLTALTQGTKATLTFDFKTNAEASNNNVLHFGLNNVVQFSLQLQSDGTYRIQTRTASNKVGAETADAEIQKDTWYTLKLVYDPFAETKVELYLDDESIYSGNHYYGNPDSDNLVQTPPLTLSGVNMTYYMRAKGTVWLDNISIGK